MSSNQNTDPTNKINNGSTTRHQRQLSRRKAHTASASSTGKKISGDKHSDASVSAFKISPETSDKTGSSSTAAEHKNNNLKSESLKKQSATKQKKHKLKAKKSKASNEKKTGTVKSRVASLGIFVALKEYLSHWSEYSFKKKALTVLIGLAAAFLIFMLLFWTFELITTPKLDMANFTFIEGSQILDKNGQYYQSFEAEEYREVITLDKVPEHVKNAFVDIEDQRFYSHGGVDIKGTTRAILSMMTSGTLEGPGGSTITQQLVKQTHLSSEKTLNRKAHEIILAHRLERVYSKDQILEAYLNKINLSQAWGIQAASKTYFGKDVSQLTLAQGAILAAMPKSPSYYDPYVYSEEGSITKEADGRCILSEDNKERAIIILDKMLELGHITQTERDEAAAQVEANQVGLTFVPHTTTYSSFTDALYDEIIHDLVKKNKMSEEDATSYILNGNLKVYSTIDQEVQAAMEASAANDYLFPSQSSVAAEASAAKSADKGEPVNYIPQVAMTVIDNATGSVAGMVGARHKEGNLSLNRATQRFQPGSSTKPLTTYGPGLDSKAITLGTVYDDCPIDYYGWRPTNSGGGHSGLITVRQGIVQSLNTIAVQACIATGIETCANYAEKAGLYINRKDQLDVNPAALALGGYSEGQSTLDMASAYSSFVNGGVHKSYSFYTKVCDAQGNVILEEDKPTETQVYSPQTAYLITDVLQQAIHGGTTTIYCNQPIAGKTGTTDDERHAWICGYTPYYSMAVWYGYDENYIETSQGNFTLNINLIGGAKPGPAAMFESVMAAINNNKPAASFAENPGGIYSATIDTISGKKASNLSAQAGHTKTEMFIDGTGPSEFDDSHYTAKICTASGLLAGPYCTSVKDEVFYKTPTLFPQGITGSGSASHLAPTNTCNVHTAKPSNKNNTSIEDDDDDVDDSRSKRWQDLIRR